MSTIGKLAGAKIKAKRKELKLTQMKLAEKLGTTFQLIQHYEKGTCEMPNAMLGAFARLCDLPVDWFLLRENELLIWVTFLESSKVKYQKKR